jgi:hypothetical protein
MTDAGPAVIAAEATAYWRAAKYWLGIWASAGFKARVEDGKLMMSKEWAEKFPEGPELVSALRHEITALLRDGNNAVFHDPRLALAYPNYVAGQIDAEEARLRHAERVADRARREIERLRKELATRPAKPV